MINPLKIRSEDKQYLVGAVIAPLAVWIFFVYRKRYSAKGMK